MNKLNTILVAALAGQLLLAAGLYIGQRPADPDQFGRPLVAFEPESIDRIVIAEHADRQATLVKQGGRWQLPDYHQLPADDGKVKQLLDALARLRGGWPVATTDGARQRFEVADDKFQRRVTLFQGDRESGRLYLGTSPGFRKIHARVAGADEVFAVDFSSYQAPGEHAGWLDPQLLRPQGEVDAIESSDFAVVKREGKWQPGGDTAGGEAVEEKVQALVADLTGLRSVAAAEDAVTQQLAARKPDHRLKIGVDGNSVVYRFFVEGDDHYVIRDGIGIPIKIGKGDYERISGYSSEQIVKQPGSRSEAKEHISG